MSYLSKACWIGLLLTLLIYGIHKICLKKFARQGKDYILYYIALVYLVTLLMITGITAPWSIHNAHNGQLIPFQDFDGRYFLLNILLFLPAGAFLPLVFQKDIKWHWKYIGFGVLLSLGIEMIQFLFTGRLADMDDVIANGIGCLAGYLVFWILKKCWKASGGKPAGYGTYGLCLSILGWLFGFPYRMGMCLGDMLLASWGFPVWSGNQGGALSFQGTHYTLVIYFAIQLAAVWVTKKYNRDLGAKAGKILSICGTVFFGLLLARNIIQNFI